jgi:hypothetical protein
MKIAHYWGRRLENMSPNETNSSERCTCGWEFPDLREIYLEQGDVASSYVGIVIACPRCNKEHSVEIAREVPVSIEV